VIDAPAIARFGLLLVRPGAMVMAAPVFGGLHVPAPVRIGLAILLGIVIAPQVPAPAAGGPVGLVVTVAIEAVIGIALAFGLRLLIGGAELAGHLAGFQMGLSYAAIVDPQSGVRNNVLAALYANLALVTFLGIDGHHAIVRALVGSYEALPLGGTISGAFGAHVAQMLGFVFVTGARLAAPVVTVLLIVELALGLIARAAPALNLMVVGAPVRLLAGLAALAVGIQVVPSVLAGAAGPALDTTVRLIRSMAR
jgi:flagellar biosynthetic protein FliR